MMTTQNRFDGKTALEALNEAAREKILVLDGAMGTMIQQRRVTEERFPGGALRRLAARPARQ